MESPNKTIAKIGCLIYHNEHVYPEYIAEISPDICRVRADNVRRTYCDDYGYAREDQGTRVTSLEEIDD